MIRYDNTASMNVVLGSKSIILQIIIPPSQHFKITGLANFVSNSNAWGSVYWTIDNNGMLLPFFGTLYDQLGTQNRPFEVNYDLTVDSGIVNVIGFNNYSTVVGSIVGMGVRMVGVFI